MFETPKDAYTVNQIAEKLQTSKQTVYNRLNSLKKELKPYLKNFYQKIKMTLKPNSIYLRLLIN